MFNLTKVTGIVLFSRQAGEIDRKITLVTDKRGKIYCFAKGARKPTSPLFAPTRTFAFGDFYIFEGKTSNNLSGAEIKNYFDPILTDYENTLYACYFAEIVEYYSKEGLCARELINLLYASFLALSNKKLDKRLIKAVFEIKVITISGECPPLDIFVDKSKKISQSAKYAFYYVIEKDMNLIFKFDLKNEAKEDFIFIANTLVSKTIDKELKTKDFLNM